MLFLLVNTIALSYLDEACCTIFIIWIIRITFFLNRVTIVVLLTTQLRQRLFILLCQLIGISFCRTALWLPILATFFFKVHALLRKPIVSVIIVLRLAQLDCLLACTLILGFLFYQYSVLLACTIRDSF